MTLDDVPADVAVELTIEMDRLFKAAGCDPTCHVCGEGIAVGKMMELVSIMDVNKDEMTDQMVCAECGRAGLEALMATKAEVAKKREDWFLAHPGHSTYGRGYSRPSKA